MRLDDILGSGASEDVVGALTFEGKGIPLVTESEWNPAVLGSDWPSPGQWCLVSAVWSDIVNEGDLEVPVSNQSLYFKDRIMYWGSGICFTLPSYDLLDEFPNTTIWQFLTKYHIEEMRINLPVVLSDPFLKIGFEATEEDPEELVAKIHEGCRIQQWIDWTNLGCDQATEPEWHK